VKAAKSHAAASIAFGAGNLVGQRALVTGAGGGIGQAIAVELAAHGAMVAAHSPHSNAAETLAELGARGVAVRGDLRKVATCIAVVEEPARKLDGLDILVNNAGITPAAKFLDVDEDTYNDAFDLNIRGYFFCAQTAVVK
jgi:NAD(P)-dependent dehydrogenase (short-subunit alcohol dehydrogenase family)